MASGRILKTQISLSEQVNDLSLAAALLFTWMIPHADDFGRMCGSSRKIKALVVPMRDDFTSASTEDCLREMAEKNLIQRYEVNGEIYIQFPSWESHQSGLHKRTKSKIPYITEEKDADIPGNSGKLLSEEKRTGIEQEQEQEQEQKKPKREKSEKSKENLPDQNLVPEEIWDEFLKLRTRLKAVNSPRAINLLIAELDRLVSQGYDPKEVVNQSIRNSWKDVYAVKNKSPPLGSSQQKRAPIKTQEIDHGSYEAVESV